MIDGKVVLVTGGTGSFGRAFVDTIVENYKPAKIIIFSRDEFKQYEMHQRYTPAQLKNMRFFLGDVRDYERLKQAFHGVDIVVHAAALKQVPAAEYNPFEFVRTNINSAENIVNAAIYNKVKRVVALSTDKAVSPINLYGATKLVSDKIFIAANNMYGDADAEFSVVRYGNVIGSRGSVIPLFKRLKEEGARKLPVTDPSMTRFWITLTQSVHLVIRCLDRMYGGEIFVPKIPSMNVVDLANAIHPNCEIEIIGIRPGEKLHEVLVPVDDWHNTLVYDDYLIVVPPWSDEVRMKHLAVDNGVPAEKGFEYSSDKNPDQLTVEQLRGMIDQ